jgi:hypothetical protein
MIYHHTIKNTKIKLKTTMGKHPVKGGNPENLVFDEYWIPDKDLGNDRLRLLQEAQGVTIILVRRVIYYVYRKAR